MPSRVNQKFAEWTHGCNVRESLQSIFSHIRDIPYSLAVRMDDPATAPEEILLLGRGSCTPKHYLLATMFRRLNLNVVYATIAFVWNDPDIRYPPHLRELAARLPVSYHLACRVQIGCRWVLVDATWDRMLASAGFPVNEHWDGYSEQRCAVKPLRSPVRTAYCRTLINEPYRDNDEVELFPVDGEKDHWEAEDRARYYRERVSTRTPEDMERVATFVAGLDAWLETVRATGRV
ncbi:MAG: hypothetical protein WC406_13500 [Methanoregula sp.]